jgi:hypothetical protein
MGIATLALAVSSLHGNQSSLYFFVLALVAIPAILKPRYVKTMV